ncbi:energy transducer TonB family protein [Burkholderia aenigmatica]|uniref:energy transducer TonB family protein n=1 Tax=Burkholderia aenigmatica TaxID=2015348 RepID=UPI003B42DE0A
MTVDDNRYLLLPIARRIARCAVLVALASLPAAQVWAGAPATQDAWTVAVRQAILQRLQIPAGSGHPSSGTYKARLSARIGRDGSVTQVEIGQSSGYADLDQAAVAAFRGGNVPAFSPDMPQDSMLLNVPIVFDLGPAQPDAGNGRRFSDAMTGLSFSVPVPLQLGERHTRPSMPLVVDVTNPEPVPRYAGKSNSLCAVALKSQSSAMADVSQRELNSPEAIANLKASIESTISILGVIERMSPIELGGGVKGQETVYSPKIGPDHERVRLYMALGDTPSYRISLTCATYVEDMPKALPLFRSIVKTMALGTSH